MQDRETARLSNGQLATLRELATDLERIVWEVSTRDGDATARQQLRAEAVRAALEALASPLSAPPQEPTGASPQAEELRAANVANLREMVGMAGRHRETLLAVRECILALSPGHRTGYDWNADPLFLTLKEGRALNLIDDALKATTASPQAETSGFCCSECGGAINAGEAKVFGVCDACWDKTHKPAPVSPVEPTPACAYCGKPATCRGSYDGAPEGFACDDCCGHGCEDGKCSPVEPTPPPDRPDPISDQPADRSEPMRRKLAALLDQFYGLHFRPGHLDAVLAAIAPVKPVEPTPEPETRLAVCDVCVTAVHCNQHWRCLAECTPSDLKVKTNPCVWRITTGPLGTWVTPSCVEGSIPAPWGTERAKSCHLCGSPLRLVPSEETPR